MHIRRVFIIGLIKVSRNRRARVNFNAATGTTKTGKAVVPKDREMIVSQADAGTGGDNSQQSRIIRAVRDRRGLYDAAHRNQLSPAHVLLLWKEVADLVDDTGE